MGKNKNKQKRNPPKNGFQSAHAPAADTNRNNREEPNMSFATESGPENVVTIKVVGVGGAGNNPPARESTLKIPPHHDRDRRNVGENHLPACGAAEQSADRLWQKPAAH